jgi:hypothetical protein
LQLQQPPRPKPAWHAGHDLRKRWFQPGQYGSRGHTVAFSGLEARCSGVNPLIIVLVLLPNARCSGANESPTCPDYPNPVPAPIDELRVGGWNLQSRRPCLTPPLTQEIPSSSLPSSATWYHMTPVAQNAPSCTGKKKSLLKSQMCRNVVTLDIDVVA